MRAARLHQVRDKLRVDSIDAPEVGAQDVLVDVRAAGICHSDLHYRNGVSPVGKLPIVLGHEIAGLVAKAGPGVRTVREGDRVGVHYVISCGICEFCTTDRETYCGKYQMMGKDVDGGLAEFVSVPERNLLRIPETVPFEHAAILGCAVSTSFHALRRARTGEGETVAVFGVGGLGAQAVQLASKIFKAGKVIAVDLIDEKLELAKRLGASHIISATQDPAERIRQITDGRFADVALDFVGRRDTIDTAIRSIGHGGRVVLVGLGSEEISISPYRTIIGKEMSLIGVNDHLKSELKELIELAGSGKIDLTSSITHRIPLEEVNYGFEILERNIGNPIRVVVVK